MRSRRDEKTIKKNNKMVTAKHDLKKGPKKLLKQGNYKIHNNKTNEINNNKKDN